MGKAIRPTVQTLIPDKVDELSEIPEIEQQVVTLETEVKGFADGLPYWAEKNLSGNAITDIEINTAYSYLLEELTPSGALL